MLASQYGYKITFYASMIREYFRNTKGNDNRRVKEKKSPFLINVWHTKLGQVMN